MSSRKFKKELIFTKEDCGEPISLEEHRQIIMQMLESLVAFCVKHHIRYTLSGGTLLGAIRHKGFIPWDDDIDINMPRPDIEKLYKISKGKIDKYLLVAPGEDRFTGSFYRLYNLDTIMENELGMKNSKPTYNPVFVDIFPVEGLPKSNILTNIYYFTATILRKTMRVAQRSNVAAKNRKELLLNYLGYLPSRIIGYKRLVRWFQKYIQSIPFNNAEYVGVMSAAKHTTEEKIDKKGYLTPIEVEFEGKKYRGPANYDAYLSQLYGEYMKMPPIDKQKTHHTFKVFRRKK
ncbi:lipopolysaccharide cholinephosphotransferase [Lachnospiraceae bacterium PM6-15]|uniref:LicD family protein n=1 Tax=Ohessyouella blattaphilus TaxID=2949333 RepID=A0ABT1EFK8_9FIRM|nr:LicD family protein [Ohessyouella blattaphilus]MCP1109485.1 LicD family protein [Ohessyouella blattaphilus]MCR8562879.1 LicD family protein [Ohessyouella blattaphilus]